MKTISYPILILFIIFVLIIIVVISSLSYDNDDKDTIKKDVSKSQTQFNLIRTNIINNCHVFNIDKIDKFNAYSIVGKFHNSNISVYKNDTLVKSIICNDYTNIILSSNVNIIKPILELNNYKSTIIPLEIEQSYTIAIDYVQELNIQNYKVNYDVIFNSTKNIMNKIEGFNEYDIDKYVKSIYREEELERINLNNLNKYDLWGFNGQGDYILAIIKNNHNYNVTDSNNSIDLQITKNDSIPEIEILNLINPNITVENLDYISVKKDINTEYLKFISGPNYLLQRFLYGKASEEINYTIHINNKVLLYKLLIN